MAESGRQIADEAQKSSLACVAVWRTSQSDCVACPYTGRTRLAETATGAGNRVPTNVARFVEGFIIFGEVLSRIIELYVYACYV